MKKYEYVDCSYTHYKAYELSQYLTIFESKLEIKKTSQDGRNQAELYGLKITNSK